MAFRGFGDALVSEWQLLSELDSYLAMSGELHSYEVQLRELRARLSQSHSGSNQRAAIRDEIVKLRKFLRGQGHDLSLARDSLRFEGFRSDDSVREGFSRAVISVAPEGIAVMTGEENHIELRRYLEEALHKAGRAAPEFHYLWYRRKGRELTLSGSDTETKEGWERLQKLYAVRPLAFLSGLRKLG